MGWDAHYDLPGMTSRLAKDTGSLPVLLLAEAVYLKSKSTYQNLQ
jgi:hypothetical protein